MRSADDIIFKIGADTRHFRAGMDSARQTVRRVAGALATYASFSGVRRVVSDLDDIGKKAGRVAMTAEALQELRFAGEMSGVSINALDIGMQRFARRIAEVASGKDNDLAKVLKANNVELRDQHGNLRKQVDILADYADLIKNTKDEANQTRLAFMAFDSEGVALVNMLKDGSAGLSDMRKEARELGVVLDEKTIKEMEDLNDEFQRYSTIIEGWGKKGFVWVADALSHVTENLSDFWSEITEGEESIANLERRLQVLRNMSPVERARSGFSEEDIKTQLIKLKQKLSVLKEFDKEMEESLALRELFERGDESTETIIPGKENENAKKVIEALKREYEQLGRTSEQQRIYNELKKAGVDIDSKYGQKIVDHVKRLEAAKSAMETSNKIMEAFKRQQDGVRESQEYLIDSAAEIGIAFTKGSDDARKALQRLVIEMVAAIAQAKLLNTGPLAGFFGFNTRTSFAPNLNISPSVNRLMEAGKGGLFANGGVTDRPAIFGEGRFREAAVPLLDGRNIPVRFENLPRMNSEPATVNFKSETNISIANMNENGIEELRRELDARDRNLEDQVIAITRDAKSRGNL